MMPIVPFSSRLKRQKLVHAASSCQDEDTASDEELFRDTQLTSATACCQNLPKNDDRIAFLLLLMVLAVVAVMTPWFFARSCYEVEQCDKVHKDSTSETKMLVHACLATFVGTLWFREMLGMAFAQTQERDLRIALIGLPRSSSVYVLLCACLFAMFMLQVFTASGSAWVHVVSPVQGFRESWGFVHSLHYVVWQIEVPILLVLCGHCVLRRPLSEVSYPAIATGCYMYIAWWALIVDIAWLRCCLIICCFSIYFWTSWRMFHWATGFLHRSSKSTTAARRMRVFFLLWLNILFAVYGFIYLFEIFDLIDSHLAYYAYAICDCSAKAVTCFFLAHFRSVERRDALAIFVAVQKRMNRASLSILRSSFDFLLPCKLADEGKCHILHRSSDVAAFERILGRSLAAVDFREILYSQRDRDLFESHTSFGFQQEKKDLIREALATPEVGENEWDEEKWFPQPPAVALVYNYDLSDGAKRKIPVSIHLSSAVGHCGYEDRGPKMMIALRMLREATPSEHGGDGMQNTAFWDKAFTSKPAFTKIPGEVQSDIEKSERGIGSSGVQSSLTFRLSSSSGSSLLRESLHLPRVSDTTPSVKTLATLSSSHKSCSRDIGCCTQTFKPQVHEVATETSIVWEGHQFRCKCCAKPPCMPRPELIKRSKLPSFAGFTGTWLLTDDIQGSTTFLKSLKIANGQVVDADGQTRSLKYDRRSASVMYEGGTMRLENGKLIRTGKSGVRYCYDRAQVKHHPFSQNQENLTMTPLFDFEWPTSPRLSRDDFELDSDYSDIESQATTGFLERET
jgi:hypothetical protein